MKTARLLLLLAALLPVPAMAQDACQKDIEEFSLLARMQAEKESLALYGQLARNCRQPLQDMSGLASLPGMEKPAQVLALGESIYKRRQADSSRHTADALANARIPMPDPNALKGVGPAHAGLELMATTLDVASAASGSRLKWQQAGQLDQLASQLRQSESVMSGNGSLGQTVGMLMSNAGMAMENRNGISQKSLLARGVGAAISGDENGVNQVLAQANQLAPMPHATNPNTTAPVGATPISTPAPAPSQGVVQWVDPGTGSMQLYVPGGSGNNSGNGTSPPPSSNQTPSPTQEIVKGQVVREGYTALTSGSPGYYLDITNVGNVKINCNAIIYYRYARNGDLVDDNTTVNTGMIDVGATRTARLDTTSNIQLIRYTVSCSKWPYANSSNGNSGTPSPPPSSNQTPQPKQDIIKGQVVKNDYLPNAMGYFVDITNTGNVKISCNVIIYYQYPHNGGLMDENTTVNTGMINVGQTRTARLDMNYRIHAKSYTSTCSKWPFQ